MNPSGPRFRRCHGLLAAALTALALGLLPGAVPAGRAQGAGAFTPVATWDSGSSVGLPARLWREPRGIALGGDGRVYVADRRLRRVEVLEGDGTPVGVIGAGDSPDDLLAPGHLALDEARGRLYVCDAGAGRVAVYALDGARLALWPGFGAPTGVAVAPDGRVLVADAAAQAIRVLGPDGVELGRWGGPGAGPGQFDGPAGLDVGPDGRVWVVDQGNERLVSAGIDGQSPGSLKLSAPQIDGAAAYDVAVDAGRLWVATGNGLARLNADRGQLEGLLGGAEVLAVAVNPAAGMAGAVLPLTGAPGVWRWRYGAASGEPLSKWAGDGLVPGFFDGIESLTVADDGRAYLLDVPERIQVLGLDGRVQAQIASPDPVEADADAAGRLYAAAGDTVYAYGADGKPLWDSRLHAAAPGADPEVVALAWDASAGELLALEAAGKRLYRLSPAGELLGQEAMRAKDATQAVWTDLVVGPDGGRWALDAAVPQIRGWDRFGRLQQEVPLPEAADRFDLLPDGQLAVLFRSGWARRLDPAGGAVTAAWDATRLNLGRPSRPVDIAADAAGRVYVADGAADVVTVYAWDAAASPSTAPQVAEGCQVLPDKVALPAEIELGQSVEVQLTARGACAPGRDLLDIALIIDAGVQDSTFKAARRSMEDFLGRIDPSTDRVVIQPDDLGGRLSGDLQYLRRLLRKLEPVTIPTGTPGFSIEAFNDGYLRDNLEAAAAELWSPRGRREARKVIIVLLAGEYGRWERSVWEAGNSKRRGAEIFALEIGRKADDKRARDISTDAAHVIKGRAEWQLADIYQQVSQAVRPIFLLRSLAITDRLPDNMRLLTGSAAPPAAVAGQTLAWSFTDIPPIGIGLRYRIQPQEAGDWPTNLEAYGDYVDAAGKAGRIVFPIPRVKVRAPASVTPPPSATPQPSATLVPSPTSAHSATPRPTATASPTPAPRAIYLPLMLRERCDPTVRFADLVLVIDSSSSMSEATPGAASKLDAAVTAARVFLDQLSLGRDRAALITFNSAVTVLVPLTADRAQLDAALSGNLQQGTGTRIGAAIAAAAEQLAAARPGSQKAMVVLTDGRGTDEDPTTAQTAADAAKAAGITLYTVGLGQDVDLAALRALASGADHCFVAPDAAELAAIYRAIAGALPCSKEAFWAGR
jgi:DNA-binding beta-propeller fold protein YncE/Mg-chelatase subunit ChlD